MGGWPDVIVVSAPRPW